MVLIVKQDDLLIKYLVTKVLDDWIIKFDSKNLFATKELGIIYKNSFSLIMNRYEYAELTGLKNIV